MPLQHGNDAPDSALKESLGTHVGQLWAWRAETSWWCPASEQGLWKGSFGTVLEAVPPAWAAPGLLLLGFASVTCVCLSGCTLGSTLASLCGCLEQLGLAARLSQRQASFLPAI